MLPMEEAVEIVLKHTTLMPVIEASNLQGSPSDLNLGHRVCVCMVDSFPVSPEMLGYVIAEDVHAQQPLPPFPASVKDGYAVIGMLA